MVNEFKLTVVHVAYPNPMQFDADLCMCVELPLNKKLWKIRTGPSRAPGLPLRKGPPGRWTVAGRGSRAAFSKTSKKRALRHALWETSAFQIFHGGNSTFINSFAKTQFLCFTLPPTQHHSFFVLRMTSYELEWQKKINISYVGGAVVVMCLKLWMKKDSLADDSVRDFKWSAKIMPFLCNW